MLVVDAGHGLAGAVKYAVTDFAARLARETGAEVAFTFGTIGQVRRRLAGGETADVIIGTAPAIAELAQAGVLVAGSRTDLGRTFTGVCVRDGAPVPDISTPETFRQAMLAARSLAYTDPQAGGTSGIFLAGLFDRPRHRRRDAPKALPASTATRWWTRCLPATPSSARPSSARSCR